MGFFDKFLGKGQPENPAPKLTDDLPRAQLAEAEANLVSGRKAEAIAVYEALLAAHPESGELFAAISADLGRHDCLEEMILTVGPAYDAARHGADAGLNLVQAHLRLGQPDGAQMWIDVLSALDRSDLAGRLAGFTHAAEKMRATETVEVPPQDPPGRLDLAVNLVSISKPLWSYSVPGTEHFLPVKQGRLRSIALLPLGAATVAGELLEAEHIANAWARGFPLAVAEALAFAPTWQPRAIVAIMPGHKLFTPPRGFGREQVRGLFRSGKDATDFAVSGFLDISGDQLGVHLDVIDVRRDRSLKTFIAAAPFAEAESALASAFAQLRQYLEAAKPLPGPFEYAPPAMLAPHLVALDHAVALFLVDKSVMPPESLGDTAAKRADALDAHAATATDATAPLLARGARAILAKLQAG